MYFMTDDDGGDDTLQKSDSHNDLFRIFVLHHNNETELINNFVEFSERVYLHSLNILKGHSSTPNFSRNRSDNQFDDINLIMLMDSLEQTRYSLNDNDNELEESPPRFTELRDSDEDTIHVAGNLKEHCINKETERVSRSCSTVSKSSEKSIHINKIKSKSGEDILEGRTWILEKTNSSKSTDQYHNVELTQQRSLRLSHTELTENDKRHALTKELLQKIDTLASDSSLSDGEKPLNVLYSDGLHHNTEESESPTDDDIRGQIDSDEKIFRSSTSITKETNLTTENDNDTAPKSISQNDMNLELRKLISEQSFTFRKNRIYPIEEISENTSNSVRSQKSINDPNRNEQREQLERIFNSRKSIKIRPVSRKGQIESPSAVKVAWDDIPSDKRSNEDYSQSEKPNDDSLLDNSITEPIIPPNTVSVRCSVDSMDELNRIPEINIVRRNEEIVPYQQFQITRFQRDSNNLIFDEDTPASSPKNVTYTVQHNSSHNHIHEDGSEEEASTPRNVNLFRFICYRIFCCWQPKPKRRHRHRTHLKTLRKVKSGDNGGKFIELPADTE